MMAASCRSLKAIGGGHGRGISARVVVGVNGLSGSKHAQNQRFIILRLHIYSTNASINAGSSPAVSLTYKLVSLAYTR